MTNNFQIVSASVSDRGLSKKRPQNEDSFLEIPERGIFAVADGVGGASAGEVASEMAVEILAEAFTNMAPGADAEDVMKIALTKANEAIFQMSQDLPSLSSMASTVVALHIEGNIATIGHVGDSRLYRLGIDGNLYQETADHSVVAEEVRAGRMTPEQAENHPSRNIISRALGAEPTIDVELKTIMFDAGTSFLICSDGVTRHVPDAEIRGLLASGSEPADMVAHIKNICYERGAEDNLTAVIIKTLPNAATKPAYQAMPAQSASSGPYEPRASYETVAEATPDLKGPSEDRTRELVFPENGQPTNPFESAAQPIPSEMEPPPTMPLDASIVPPIGLQSAAHLPPTNVDMPPVSRATNQFESVALEPPPSRNENGETGIAAAAEAHTAGSGTLGKVASSVLLLVLGSVIGMLGFYFVVLPYLVQQPGFPLPREMKSTNEALTTFEENRRTVDQSPKDALNGFGAAPEDAEDYFLVGRAHLLLGQYPEARAAFITSEEKIAAGNVDPKNVNTIRTEIAIYSSVTSDTTIQGILKKNLDAARPAANTNSNSNVSANR